MIVLKERCVCKGGGGGGGGRAEWEELLNIMSGEGNRWVAH